MQRNKVYAVMSMAKVAQDLGESVELIDELSARWTPKTV